MGKRRLLTALLIGTLVILSAGTAVSEALIERGAYLVNGVMACANCHTPRDGNAPILSKALAGGRVFDTPAFKAFSSNITPDKDTGIGGWSDIELKKFMTTGARPSGVPVAPIMPSAFYKVLTPRDLDALVVYLRSVAAVRNEVPPSDYRKAFTDEAAPFAERQMTDAEMSDPVKRGMYLCHAGPLPRMPHAGRRRRPRLQEAAGGRAAGRFQVPGELRSSNITSHKTVGLGSWSDDEIKRAITQGVSRDGSRLKPPMAFAAYARISGAGSGCDRGLPQEPCRRANRRAKKPALPSNPAGV